MWWQTSKYCILISFYFHTKTKKKQLKFMLVSKWWYHACHPSNQLTQTKIIKITSFIAFLKLYFLPHNPIWIIWTNFAWNIEDGWDESNLLNHLKGDSKNISIEESARTKSVFLRRCWWHLQQQPLELKRNERESSMNQKHMLTSCSSTTCFIYISFTVNW